MATIGRRALLTSSAALGLSRGVSAETWPARPIKFIVPFAPGGGTDVTARLVAEKMSARLGQTVLVDNRPGAGGNLGAEAAIKSPPDGYTFLSISGSYAVNAVVHKPSFDSVKDVVAIGQYTDEPTVLCVNPGMAVRTLKEFVELCRSEPGKETFGSSGAGGLSHLDAEFFLDAAGVKATHVPYRGTGPALNDLIAGNIQMLIGGTTSMLPYTKSNQVRPLAITKRISAIDVPTFGEQGYPTLDFNLWHGLLGPKDLPPEIVQRMNTELNAVLKSPEVADRLAADGVVTVGGTPEAFMTTLRTEVKRWQDFVQRTGIKLE